MFIKKQHISAKIQIFFKQKEDTTISKVFLPIKYK